MGTQNAPFLTLVQNLLSKLRNSINDNLKSSFPRQKSLTLQNMAMWVLKKFRLVILIWHQHHVDFHQRHVESPRVAWSCPEWPGVMLIWHQRHVDFHQHGCLVYYNLS